MKGHFLQQAKRECSSNQEYLAYRRRVPFIIPSLRMGRDA